MKKALECMVRYRTMATMVPGEEKAWELLAGLAADDVCRRTGSRFVPASNHYAVTSFGQEFIVDPAARTIAAASDRGELFLGKLAYFFRLSLLWYLVKAHDAAPSGRHVKPGNLPGGDIFFKGSHVLPLSAVAKMYAADREGFMRKGGDFGGFSAAFGDAGVELMPFPRIPVTMILWLQDEEWESRCELLFDSTAPVHLPIDILWSIAMMSTLIFL